MSPYGLMALLLLTPAPEAPASATPASPAPHLVTVEMVQARLAQEVPRPGVSSLTPAELQELATRAGKLQTDPAAGGTGKTLLITGVVLVAAFVVFLALAWSNLPE